MKKVVLTGSLMMLSFGVFAQSNTADLPADAQEFIENHFSEATVEAIQVEDEGWFEGDEKEKDKYEVRLSNGLQLDFSQNGNISEIENEEGAAIPQDAISGQIRSYVEDYYENATIKSWSLDDNEQEVELSNGNDLVFDQEGSFLKED